MPVGQFSIYPMAREIDSAYEPSCLGGLHYIDDPTIGERDQGDYIAAWRGEARRGADRRAESSGTM